MNIIKQKQTHRCREKTSGYRQGEEMGVCSIGEGITRYKLLGIKEAPRIYFITWGILPIFHNDYKWSTTFENCESFYCRQVTYTILYSSYTRVKSVMLIKFENVKLLFY